MEHIKRYEQDLKEINLYELIGIIIGDGSIWNYPHSSTYALEITGNAYEEQDYYKRISKFIEALINKKPRVYTKYEKLGRSLKLVVFGKKFVHYLINDLEITNKNKTFDVRISSKFLDWKYSQHILRGLLDTDGSLYFSKSGGKIGYPRLEIKTSSIELAKQVLAILEQNNFKPHTITKKSDRTISIYLSGPKMLEKWYSEIGFGSSKNLTKYQFWKKFGYYIPRLSLKERLKVL